MDGIRNIIPSQLDWGTLISSPVLAPATVTQPVTNTVNNAANTVTTSAGNAVNMVQNTGSSLLNFLPNLLGALAVLIIGWIVATFAASLLRGLLKRTSIDERLSNWTGASSSAPLPIAKWLATAVYWIILAFTIVGFLNALQLQGVSAPLNGFLQQIFSYLPRLASAGLLLLGAWVLATVCKMIVTRGLSRLNLDSRIAQHSGDDGGTPFLLSDTLGNALYWFIFLFFLPMILNALDLQGPLAPVQNLLNQFLGFLPNLISAVIIGAVGWFLARVIRGIATNMSAALGVDQLASRVGLTTSSTGGLSLSGLIGTIAYIAVLVPSIIAALNALRIEAISGPAVSMLQRIFDTLPQIITAGVILAVFFFIGRFVADLVTSILKSIGFDNLFNWLGLSGTTVPRTTPDGVANGQAALTSKSPSEVAGIVTLVGIMLVGTVTATDVLGIPALTGIVNSLLAIAGRVLVGVIIFAVGLWLANVAYRLIASAGNRQADILGQAARVSILAFVAAMALQQMGIASNIVNLAFGLLLGAVAVATALAFGLGGRDVAGDQIRGWLSSFNNAKSESSDRDLTRMR